MLRIVERDMLVVDPGKRIKAHDLLAKMNCIVAGAETSASAEASKRQKDHPHNMVFSGVNASSFQMGHNAGAISGFKAGKQ